MAQQTRFSFDGGAATFLGTAILGAIITIFTLGICYPFALVLTQRWQAKHTYIDGQQLIFTGSATGLFGHWIKWLLLCVVTLGIYSFWVIPRMKAWVTVNTTFAQPVAPLQSWAPNNMGQNSPQVAPVASPVAAPVVSPAATPAQIDQ